VEERKQSERKRARLSDEREEEKEDGMAMFDDSDVEEEEGRGPSDGDLSRFIRSVVEGRSLEHTTTKSILMDASKHYQMPMEEVRRTS